jgi:hypothetical protein
VSGDDGDAEERPDNEEPRSDVEPRSDEGEPRSEAERHSEAERRSEAGAGGEATSRVGRALPFFPALYFAGFAVVLISFAALALGGLALLGRGIDASPTGFFWASIVLSVVALGLALAALFAPRRR